ncbi:hypothetical protein [Sporolactobacillus laevolacticus]|uniref:hypothetical protein n=1 Tax=Sporolactobacillus laevolacticus TaxID=33018 RepID=UPI0025B33351|nr:hypothetical protein [Sporolactobacillus laevolacticus]MDN3953905.1 hypothetical protein [Sporolactobacillus laevolacticus]
MKRLLRLFTAIVLSLGILSGVALPQGVTQTTSQNVAYAKSYPINIVSSHLNVHRGNPASITIKGKPNASGTIKVIYKSGPSKARGLNSKMSNKKGYITWTWLVGGNTTKATYTFYVSLGGKTKPVKLKVY